MMEEMPKRAAPSHQILLGRTADKTTTFLRKSIKSIRSHFVGEQKNNNAPSVVSFSFSTRKARLQEVDDFRSQFSERHEYDYGHEDQSKTSNSVMLSRDSSMKIESASCLSLCRNAGETDGNGGQEGGGKEEKKTKKKKKTVPCHKGKRRQHCSQAVKGSIHALPLMIKVLDMMDIKDDEDHVSDIEEALHNYSLLTSPVYLDIVDTFFTDMYSEFFFPRPAMASVNNSMRRPRPLKL